MSFFSYIRENRRLFFHVKRRGLDDAVKSATDGVDKMRNCKRGKGEEEEEEGTLKKEKAWYRVSQRKKTVKTFREWLKKNLVGPFVNKLMVFHDKSFLCLFQGRPV